MAEDHISCPQLHFDELYEEFSCGLRESAVAKSSAPLRHSLPPRRHSLDGSEMSDFIVSEDARPEDMYDSAWLGSDPRNRLQALAELRQARAILARDDRDEFDPYLANINYEKRKRDRDRELRYDSD